jgi:uncharacterized repeat protein (TIGR01451 family)
LQSIEKEKNMKVKHHLVAALAITALAAIGAPQAAEANSTANTTILNVVRVDYKDVSGANNFAANASTKVTVNLVKAALNPSGAPTGANGNPALSCLNFEAASTKTVQAIYAYTATANGQDSYSFSIANTPTNVTGVSVSYDALDYTGAVVAAAPSRVLGSAIPIGVVGANTLEFPGGALAGFGLNDIVVVDVAGTKKAYLVTGVNPGKAPNYSNLGDVAHSSTGSYSQAEEKGTLTLGAYANQTVTLNTPNDTTFGGGNSAPTFDVTPPTLGVPVGEMVLVKMTVTASATLVDGSVSYTLTATDGANPSAITCSVPFKAPTLTIKKEARNVSSGGSFGATATGNPGQLLEYRVTVANAGGQAAQVTVADAVPAYTTLVTHGGYGDGAGTGVPGNVIAELSDGTVTVVLTMDDTDSEPQPMGAIETGFGKATAVTTGAPITFYLGDSSSSLLGGKLPYCSNGTSGSQATCNGPGERWITSFTILYQVKID